MPKECMRICMHPRVRKRNECTRLVTRAQLQERGCEIILSLRCIHYYVTIKKGRTRTAYLASINTAMRTKEVSCTKVASNKWQDGSNVSRMLGHISTVDSLKEMCKRILYTCTACSFPNIQFFTHTHHMRCTKCSV